MSSITLDLTQLTGEITSDTPWIVTEEVLDSHGITDYDRDQFTDHIYYSYLCGIIKSKPKNKVTQPYDNKDYRTIARFVNKSEKWKKKPLLEAYDYLQSFFPSYNFNKSDESNISESNISESNTSESNISESNISESNISNVPPLRSIDDNGELIIGLQTISHPYSLNASVLYYITQKVGIKVNANITLEELSQKVKTYWAMTDSDVLYQAKYAIYQSLKFNTLSTVDIINMLTMNHINGIDISKYFNSKIIHKNRYDNDNNTQDYLESPYSHYTLLEDSDEEVTYDTLQDTAVHLTNLSSLVDCLPQNNIEAIILVALKYKLDISTISNPSKEWQAINKDIYFPLDIDLSQAIAKAEIHPESLENPWLDQCFNPYLPVELYTRETLDKLYEGEGLDQGELSFESPYHGLQLACVTPTFYHGFQTGIENEETTWLDEIVDLAWDEIAVYGIVNEGLFTAFTYDELEQCFNYYKRFQDPHTNEIFEDNAINKLLVLCSKAKRQTETDIMYNNRQQLKSTIETVKLYQQTNTEQIRTFIDTYNKLSETQKDRIEELLVMVLEMAMYMRGWTGDGPYPLNSMDTLSYDEDQATIDFRVTKAIHRFEEANSLFLDSLSDQSVEGLSEQLLLDVSKLPLIFYSSSKEFILSTDEDEGITIADRIFIVKGGEDQNLQSCIRLSSNRFCASGYYYLTLLGEGDKLGFTMDDVSYIS